MPPELVEQRKKEVEMLYALMEASSSPPDCSDGDENDGKPDLGRRRALEKILHKHSSGSHQGQPPATRLPTPSPSDCDSSHNCTPPYHQSPSSTSDDIVSKIKTRKRRRLEDTEKESQPMNKKVRTIATVPSRSRRSAPLCCGTG